jgi:Outer membrane protein beta-barrel domain
MAESRAHFTRESDMTHKFRGIAVLAVLAGSAAMAAPASAQGFTVSTLDVGPTIGLGGIGSASITIGGRLEKAIKDLPTLGNGILGIQASFDYYSYGESGFHFRYIPIGATANYHFVLKDSPKIDPFIGLGLGYSILSCDTPSVFGIDICPNSGIYFIGRLGGRYYFQDKIALYGDVGAGAATLNIGLMFRLQQ